MNRIKYLLDRFFFRIKQKDSFFNIFKLITKNIFYSSNKIDLDQLQIDKNFVSLEDLCLKFGADKGYYDSKKAFWNYYKNLETRSEFKNYLDWINREDPKNYDYELGLNYAPLYEKYFHELRNKEIKILEIGVAAGHSLACWYFYFPKAQIWGIDVKEKSYVQYKGKRMSYHIIDCLDDDSVENFAKKFGSFDIIIDDSIHDHPAFETNMKNFYPYLKSGGYYCLEDFRNSDRKLEGIRKYNQSKGNKLWKYNITMAEMFDFMKNKKFFKQEIFKKKDLEYIFDNTESINVHYQEHPTSSLGVMKKK